MRSVLQRSKSNRASGLKKHSLYSAPRALNGLHANPSKRPWCVLFGCLVFCPTVVLISTVALFLCFLSSCDAKADVPRADLKLNPQVSEQSTADSDGITDSSAQAKDIGMLAAADEVGTTAADERVLPVYRWLPGSGPAAVDDTDAADDYRFTDAELDKMSSEKVGWGVKLRGHQQPEIYDSTRQMLGKYNSVYIGEQGQKTLYLTFDAGYENGYTADILDTLREKGVSAAFFITGYYLDQQEELVSRMIAEGHIVGNHTDTHKCLPEESDVAVEKDIMDLELAYREVTGTEMARYMRPPSGEYSERSLALAARMGYMTVLWSFAYVDYDETQYRGDEYAFGKIAENFHDGAIMLLHAESKENAAVLGRVIDEARAEGYTFSRLDLLA